ncbi:MAG: hypothetical protein C4532_13525 [Candidatus Abyssobacteria bacterium SURF_17]|uniref:PLAT domain-containing protein n=1 Tax=Candidatus Abyssobacteria bacterium SURF_17 TaxID=2093361 RepID=A0A419EV58_9BACT|nr:MAG: hypothetical protein C4532_13525 [Candidatus Abyssubacteria bacterium SURF_17]
MIGPMDEYLIHQIVAPVAKVVSDNPNWQDRFYFNFIDPEKRLAGILGMGVFPNGNFFQGILNIVADEKLICRNYFRPLENDRHQIHAGSLRIEVAEPLRKWDIKLDEPDLNVSLNLGFTGRGEAYEFDAIKWEKNGAIVWNQCHYTQAGAYGGLLRVGDRTITRLVGIRDRSWGIRDMFQLDFWIWISANFDRYWLTAWLGETSAGDLIAVDGAVCGDDGSRERIVSLDYDIAFVKGLRTPASSSYRIQTETGRTMRLSARALQTIYVSLIDGIYDLTDRQILAEKDESTIIFDQVQEFDLDGDSGLGLIEFFVMGGCHKYPDTWNARR